MTPTELSRYQETAWNNWIRRKLTSSELALCETRTDCSRRGQTHFKSVNDSEADVLSLRRYGRANHRGGAERVRHRAADSVRGKAPLLAVRLGEDCYAISAKDDRQQDHVLVVDPPARRVAGRADDRDRALGAFDGERLQTLSGGASAMASDAGNATAAAVNAPSARSRFMCSPVDEVAVDIHYPARNVIQSRVERLARTDAGPGPKAVSPWSARNADANRHRGQQAATA